MKRSSTLLFTIPLMIIISGFFIYQYGYLKVQADIASLKEGQDIKTKTLEKYVNLIAEKPQLQEKLTSLKEARKAEDSKLIEGLTLSLAAAQLQEIVKSTINARGGTISSERVGKPEDRGAFRIISVSIDAVLPDARALSDILYAIETRTPYLVVKELDVRVKNYRDPRELMVKLDVSAMTEGR